VTLQENFGIGRLDLLGHSAGANLAVQYAARCPARLNKLALITPSTRAIGLAAASEMRREIVRLRRHEPWFPDAAFERIQADGGTRDDWATTPGSTTAAGSSPPQPHFLDDGP
jgi:proline iminopeptidase